jgi:2-oxoglutarate ferredoxin oxidoreductase subunit alpha
MPTDHLRVRAVPFSDEVEQFIRDHERVYVVELNRDGQLRDLLLLNMPEELATRIYSAALMDGLPLSARWVKDEINKHEAAFKNGKEK